MCNYIPSKYRKYMTLVGGVLIHISLASSHTFGNMSPYIISYLRSYDDIDIRYTASMWIFTWLGVAMSFSTILGGFLTVKFKLSLKFVTFLGCVLISLSHFLTYFSLNHSFITVILTFGLINGLGIGIAYVNPLSIGMKWFPDNKGLANSAILFGSGAGGVLFTQLETLYINPENYAPDMPYSDQFPNEKYFSVLHKDLLERVPKTFIILGIVFSILQIIGLILISEVDEKEVQECKDSINSEMASDSNTLNEDTKNYVNSIGVRYNMPQEGLSMKEVVKKRSFRIMVFLFNFFVIAPDLYAANYKSFGQTFIRDDQFLALIGSISNIFTSFGRFFWGYVVDKFSFKLSFLIINTAMMALMLTVTVPFYFKSKVLYLVWTCLILFFHCGLFVITPTAVAKCFGQKYFSSIYGLIIFLGIGVSFIEAFIAPLSDTIGWFGLFCVCVSFLAICWIVALFFDVKGNDGNDI